jgi:hypothetical protein
MLGDRFLEVEAQSEAEAQEQAFARTVRDLTPADFTAWVTGPQDDWNDEEKGEQR